jgi:hypothetical protein
MRRTFCCGTCAAMLPRRRTHVVSVRSNCIQPSQGRIPPGIVINSSPSVSLIRIVLMGLRIAKVYQHPIPQISGYEPVELVNGLGDAFLKGQDDLPPVLTSSICFDTSAAVCLRSPLRSAVRERRTRTFHVCGEAGRSADLDGNCVYETVSAGGIVGEMAMVDGSPRSATVCASVFSASGYGARAGFSTRPAVLVIDVSFNFCGDRPEPFWSLSGAGRIRAARMLGSALQRSGDSSRPPAPRACR